jgi:hypothetical protein
MTVGFWHERCDTGANFGGRLTPSGWGGGFPTLARVIRGGRR